VIPLYKSISDISWSVGVTQHGCYFQVLIQVDVVPGNGVLLAAGDDVSKAAIAVEWSVIFRPHPWSSTSVLGIAL